MSEAKQTSVRSLILELRSYADSGGYSTRVSVPSDLLVQAADKLEQMEERIAIMTENENKGHIDFPVYGGNKT